MTLIIVISTVYFIDIIAVIFLLWNRQYPPLKSKNPVLMACALCSCICWFIGDLQINGHVHLKNTILTNCKGIGVWIRVLLGVCTVSALIALRSYGLYRIFCQNRLYKGFGFYLPFLIYCTCTLIYGIITQVLKPSVTVEYIPDLDICYCPRPFRAALYGYIWITWVLIAIINWKIRNIKSSFNESREMAFSCAVVFAILTFSTAMQFSQPNYPLNQILRLLTTGMDHLSTNLVWWAIVGIPLINCLFNHKGYLEKWTLKLKEDGLQHEYNVKLEPYNTTETNITTHSEDKFNLYDNGSHTPEFLLNDKPRPPSRKIMRPYTYERQSYQTTIGRSARLSNPDDPFDIPPAFIQNTTQMMVVDNDPFHLFSSGPMPTNYSPATNHATHTVTPPAQTSGNSQIVFTYASMSPSDRSANNSTRV
ncbi:hypothetical protein COEREDRAFT_16241 [Coemansia reversa NRRL 1564]|uniref:G-protein coupled receptors family 3 profile domain-containing protein n=1 Tax=Coemansia reversa (strain ATCC 12441 / NRRL 1564) TaxID=763665 RepID=A0A2G5B8N8_COERN|nr:hypothetical protein COEREDRAFT_16241 [Coemansia reversa NRRL 1564]|eukprot:PIA15371.1 hypothetical protein COEREDRAFT_16241 [Coemansia reversa NRRL 1564]